MAKLLIPPMLWVGMLATGVLAEGPVYPVKVSPNGRYFVDQKGEPVFWLGTTQWQLLRDNAPEEAAAILANAKANGFAFVQVMLLGVGDGTRPNVRGQKPWTSYDPLTPNEAYFRGVDAVIQAARRSNVNISLTLYHQRWRKLITARNGRAWAKWLAGRYKDVPTIVWSMTPEARQEFVAVLRELAAGLREGDGGAHLITFKPDPAPYSSSFIHEEKWLAFDSMQTWRSVNLIYPMVTKDYGLKPVKPVLMAEGAYEAGTEYGFDVTPLWVRRQAYYSYLCGGHFTYGHNDSWRMLPTWKKALGAPGAVQMGILRKIFLDRKEWWRLVPDQAILASGGNTKGDVLNLAARHEDGKWIMVYLGAKATFSVNMGKLTPTGKARAIWIDPRSGLSTPAGSFPASRVRGFSTPEGWEDALLVVEPADTPTAAADGIIENGTVWRDTSGKEIWCNGGHMIRQGDTFYWVGYETGPRRPWHIKLYSSKDLADWKFENDLIGKQGEFAIFGWAGRPAMLHHRRTGRYVILFEGDSPGWKRHKVGFARCDRIDGRYELAACVHPEGTRTTGDQSAYQEGEEGYLVCTMDHDAGGRKHLNTSLAIFRLTDDYLGIKEKVYEGFEGRSGPAAASRHQSSREASHIIKVDGTYYWLSSGLQGWSSTQTKYATARSLAGPWSPLKTLPTDPPSGDSYNTQHDFVIPVVGSQATTWLYVGDRYSQWTRKGTGRNIFLPLTWKDGSPTLWWRPRWKIDVATGRHEELPQKQAAP